MSRYEPGYFAFGECVLLDGEVIVDNRTFAEDAARELNAIADTIRLKSESLRIESENVARLRTKLVQTEIERDSALERARLWNESEVLMRNRAIAAEEEVGRLREDARLDVSRRLRAIEMHHREEADRLGRLGSKLDAKKHAEIANAIEAMIPEFIVGQSHAMSCIEYTAESHNEVAERRAQQKGNNDE